MREVPEVVVIGILPPPVTGMSLVVDRMTELLGRKWRVRVLNLSNGLAPDSLRCRIGKFLRFWSALGRLAAWSIRGRFRIYFAPDSGCGMYYNLLVALIACAGRHPVILHHEAYAYTARFDRRMDWITKLLGTRALHVLLCDSMLRQFVERYPAAVNCIVLSNSFAVVGIGTKAPRQRATLVLGHISNLSVEKGFDLVLRTFEAAREEGLDVRLRLAGPTRSAVEARMLANVLKRHGGRVHYVGPVYGVDKEAFYNAIDLVLFPTRYRNEADPLVLLEALDHGVPVIAYSRGCIQEHVPAEAGCVVDADEDFSERALAVIRDYVSSPAKLDRASEDAIRYVPKMRDRAHADLEGVLSAIGSL